MASVTLPEDLYARLAEEAEREGLSLQALIASLLAERARGEQAGVPAAEQPVEGYDPAADPLARFAGIFASDDPGWIARHDEYFGGNGHGSSNL